MIKTPKEILDHYNKDEDLLTTVERFQELISLIVQPELDRLWFKIYKTQDGGGREAENLYNQWHKNLYHMIEFSSNVKDHITKK